jgi:fibronectin type 3 domain-containing protein
MTGGSGCAGLAGASKSVSLSSTDVTPHTVELTWNPSSSLDVVGYNIYRGTISGMYSQLNSSPLAVTSYSDSTVQSGQSITYYYVVTSVSSTGVESTDSNQAFAVVP